MTRNILTRFATISVVTLAVVVLLGLSAGTVTAQTSSTHSTNATAVPGQQVQPGLSIVSTSLDSDAKMARITFLNTDNRPVGVTLADAGAFIQGGEVPRRTIVVPPGRHTFSMSVTLTSSGAAGLSVSTDKTLYSVILRDPSTILGGPYTKTDVRTAAISGGLTVAFVTGLLTWRRARRETEQPERIA